MSKLSYSEIEKGINIIIDKKPYKVLETSSMFKARGHSVLQAKIKNLETGDIIPKTIHPSDSFEEAEIDKISLVFVYSHRGNYIFSEKENPSKRVSFTEGQVAYIKEFLKEGQEVQGLIFNDKIISVQLPIKIVMKVKNAPPGIKGNTAEGGTKNAILETGAEISVPLFVNQGDIIEINTEKREYVRRVEKSKEF
jgi:elongation factor P